MATGDAALAAGMDLVDGNSPANTLATEDNKTRDYIAERTNAITPVEKGGTGADNAAAARSNLGVVLTGTSADSGGKVPIYSAGGQLATATPTSGGHAASKSYVDGAIPSTAGLVSLTYLNDRIGPGASVPIYSAGGPATSGYSVAYINVDGRVSRGASSERYKKFISEIDPGGLGDIWPSLTRYQMRHGDGAWKYGYIAERLDENDDQRPFVVYQTETLQDEETGEWVTQLAVDEEGAPVPESIDFIALLMAQNAQLHQAVELLAQRVDALEAS